MSSSIIDGLGLRLTIRSSPENARRLREEKSSGRRQLWLDAKPARFLQFDDTDNAKRDDLRPFNERDRSRCSMMVLLLRTP